MSDARFKSVIDAMNTRREETGIEIGGKKYAKVSDRVEMFRTHFGAEFGIDTNMSISNEFGSAPVVIVSAKIVSVPTGTIVGSGTAMGFYGSDAVNTTSVIEATETSAIGRALASFGLAGGEYASEREMLSLPDKQRAVDNMSEGRKVRQGSNEPPRSEKEAEFRHAVDKAFPPSVNQYEFYIPDNVDPQSIDGIFAEIDRIVTVDELTAYWTALEETLQWVRPEDADEIKATFKSRNKQLKGM